MWTTQILVSMALFLGAAPGSPNPPAGDQLIEPFVAKWQLQINAAKQDEVLINKTRVAFLVAADGEKTPLEVDATLVNLRKRLPDYRLSYRNPADRCLVLRGLSSASASATQRAIDAYEVQLRALALSTFASRIKVALAVSSIKGEALDESAINRLLVSALPNLVETEPTTNFSGMDWLDLEMAQPCD